MPARGTLAGPVQAHKRARGAVAGLNGAPRPRESPARMRSALHTDSSGWRRARVALALVLALAAAGCVSFDQDLHLSPLWSDLSTAVGGREREGLAGVVRQN